MGINNVVILNDIEAVRVAFSKDTILDRPSHGVITLAFGSTGFADDSGHVWQEQRQVSLHLLKDLGFGKTNMVNRIIQEIAYLIERIDKTEGKPTNIHRILSLSVANNTSQFIFGHRFDLDDPKFIDMSISVERAASIMSKTGILTNIPHWINTFIVRTVLIGYGRTLRKMLNIFE